VILAIVVSALPACAKKSEGSPQPAVTQTIAPAAAQPEANGTDAMTGTVEVEENRSENEGGVLTDPQPGTKTATAAHKASTAKKSSKASKKP
jgi:hypothetical protein